MAAGASDLPIEENLRLSFGSTLPNESVLLPFKPAPNTAERSLKSLSLLLSANGSASAVPAGDASTETRLRELARALPVAAVSRSANGDANGRSPRALDDDELGRYLALAQEASLNSSSTFRFDAMLAATLPQPARVPPTGDEAPPPPLPRCGVAQPPSAAAPNLEIECTALAAGEDDVSPSLALRSLRENLIRNTVEDALAESDDQPMTVRLDAADLSGEFVVDVRTAASGCSPAKRPAALTEDFYDADSDEETMPDLHSCGSLSYSRGSASSSFASGTMRSATLGLTCNAASCASPYAMNTEEALRAALCDFEVRTPTPPGRVEALHEISSMEGPSASASGVACSHPAARNVALDKGQLEAFSSALRSAEGLDGELQKDLLAILHGLPTQPQKK